MVKYKITFKKSVVKDLRSIPNADITRILERIDKLSDNPRAPGCINLTATVNDAAVQGQCMLLSGEICSTSDRQITSETLIYKCLGSLGSITLGERT